jgi:hypothetical protein
MLFIKGFNMPCAQPPSPGYGRGAMISIWVTRSLHIEKIWAPLLKMKNKLNFAKPSSGTPQLSSASLPSKIEFIKKSF